MVILSPSHLKDLLFTFKSPSLRICLISFKVIQILNPAVSGEMLQIAFSFQNSVKVTLLVILLDIFFNFKCVLQTFI